MTDPADRGDDSGLSELDVIILKLYRPHPSLQPEDKAFLNDPKCIEAKRRLEDWGRRERISELYVIKNSLQPDLLIGERIATLQAGMGHK